MTVGAPIIFKGINKFISGFIVCGHVYIFSGGLKSPVGDGGRKIAIVFKGFGLYLGDANFRDPLTVFLYRSLWGRI
jgi:hypothetical protein